MRPQGAASLLDLAPRPLSPDTLLMWTRASLLHGRGKSGLHRAVSLLTAGRGDPTESATENRPPMDLRITGKGETVG